MDWQDRAAHLIREGAGYVASVVGCGGVLLVGAAVLLWAWRTVFG